MKKTTYQWQASYWT